MGIVKPFDTELFDFEQGVRTYITPRVSSKLLPGITKDFERAHKISSIVGGTVLAVAAGITGITAVGVPYLIYGRQMPSESPFDYLFLVLAAIGLHKYTKDIISSIKYQIKCLRNYHRDVEKESTERLGLVLDMTAHNLAEKTIVDLYTKNLMSQRQDHFVTHFSYN